MFNLDIIKQAVAAEPLLFLRELYGDTVTESDKGVWRIGTKGGKKFDTLKGELLACDFTGDDESGDCFTVWQKHNDATFSEAVAAIAALYGIGPGGSSVPRTNKATPPRIDREAKLNEPLPRWPMLDARHDELWRTGIARLIEDANARERIASWRGWPAFTLIQLAKAGLLGVADFALWPAQVRPQECALFRVLHPERVREPETRLEFFHWRPVQLHCRFTCSGAATRDGRPLSWLYCPTKREHKMDEGGNAPLIIARDGRDPEQPGYGTRCECVIVCAGEWDSLTVLLAFGRIDDNGSVTLPSGLAIVGIRGEGRGGTDAYLRHYKHWRPRSVVMLADADKTGLSWFKPSPDGRAGFAEQLEQRGAKVIPRVPKGEGIKDVSDLYRTGQLGLPDIEEMLTAAGFAGKGGSR